jgi:peptidyl-prolyl cis-trans isomerase C
MKKITLGSFIVLSMFTAISAFTAYAEEKDKTPVAQANGNDVYKWEVDDIIARVAAEKKLKEKPSFDTLTQEEKLAVVKEVVAKRLLNDEVKKSDIADEKDIKEKLQAINSELLQNEFLSRKVKAAVTAEKVKARYDELAKSLNGKEEIKVRHILVESKEEADKIAKQLAKKPDLFQQIAKKQSKDSSSSNGGDLGYFLKGTMVKEIEDVAFALKKGEISPVVKTSLGWHIIKIDDRRAATIAPFDAVRSKIEQELGENVVQDYIKGLLKDAKIELAKK